MDLAQWQRSGLQMRACWFESQWAATFAPVLCLGLGLQDVFPFPLEQSTHLGVALHFTKNPGFSLVKTQADPGPKTLFKKRLTPALYYSRTTNSQNKFQSDNVNSIFLSFPLCISFQVEYD